MLIFHLYRKSVVMVSLKDLRNVMDMLLLAVRQTLVMQELIVALSALGRNVFHLGSVMMISVNQTKMKIPARKIVENLNALHLISVAVGLRVRMKAKLANHLNWCEG